VSCQLLVFFPDSSLPPKVDDTPPSLCQKSSPYTNSPETFVKLVLPMRGPVMNFFLEPVEIQVSKYYFYLFF